MWHIFQELMNSIIWPLQICRLPTNVSQFSCLYNTFYLFIFILQMGQNHLVQRASQWWRFGWCGCARQHWGPIPTDSEHCHSLLLLLLFIVHCHLLLLLPSTVIIVTVVVCHHHHLCVFDQKAFHTICYHCCKVIISILIHYFVLTLLFYEPTYYEKVYETYFVWMCEMMSSWVEFQTLYEIPIKSLWHCGYGYGIATGMNFLNCTCTCIMGIPAPMPNPSGQIQLKLYCLQSIWMWIKLVEYSISGLVT